MSGPGGHRPPRLLAWLLHRLAPPSSREHLAGDLEEEFGARVRRDGQRGPAVRWYLSQIVRSTPHLVGRRAIEGIGGWLALDLRHALRSLSRSPAFSLVAVGSLALGIGANTIVFTFVHGLLVEPLPLPGADRLVLLQQTRSAGTRSSWLSVPDYEDLRSGTTTLEALGAVTPDAFIVRADDEARYVGGAEVSTDYFDVLGVRPVAGRLFGPQDDETRRIVIGEGAWSRWFGRDPDAVGSVVQVDGSSTEIIGVAPAEADVFGQMEVWIPMRTSIASWRQSRGTDWIRGVGRMRSGVDAPANRSELAQMGVRLAEAFPETNADQGFTASPLDEWLTGSTRAPLLILMAAVLLVLLIACANLAGLLLARGLARTREVATQIALGVGRGRLFVRLLTESLLLAAAGGGLGLTCAMYGVPLIRERLPADLPRLAELGVDGPVLRFSAAITVGATLVFGLAPAWAAVRGHVSEALTDRLPSGTRGHALARRSLVVGQMALALVLLVGSSLLLRSFARLSAVDLGIRTTGVVTARLPLVDADFPGNADRTRHYRRLLAAVRQAAGIERAALVNAVPLRDTGPTFSFETTDVTRASEEDRLAGFSTVMGDYFGVMDVDVVRGRTFEAAELDGERPAVVVDRAFERAFFPDGAVGKEIEVVDRMSPIVGVVESVPQVSPGVPAGPRMYVPLTANVRQTMAVVAYSGLPEAEALTSMTEAIRTADPRQTIQSPLPMASYRSRSLQRERVLLGLLGAMGLVALLLAALGTYGILAYVVSRRTREIGIRIAMGADAGSLRRMILASTAKMVAVSLLVGSGLALLGVRLLEGVLYDTPALDPVSFLGASLVLALTAVASSYLPAARATRTSPVEALRAE